MRPSYEVVVDEARHSVRARMHGFWDVATTLGYLAELSAAAARVAGGGARSWWLIDLTETVVQSREVATLIGDRLPRILPAGAAVAVASPASLTSMQAKRVVADGSHRHFATVEAARAWLAEQGCPD